MKSRFFLIILCLLSFPLFAQTEIAPGALNNLAGLLNKPTLVKPSKATSLEKNWYRMNLDSHMFTDQASFKQIVSVMSDIENYAKFFDGKNSKLRTDIVCRENNEMIVDITSITIAFIRVTLKYRTSVNFLENTDTKYICEFRQLDSETNDQIKNLHLIRYAEEVTINGKNYTYLRMSSINDTYVGFKLPNIPSLIEKNLESSNTDILNMIIEAAKGR